MTTHTRKDFYTAVPDAGLTVSLDEGPGEGNSAPALLTFLDFDAEATNQTVLITGEWERVAAGRALRWAADLLDPDGGNGK